MSPSGDHGPPARGRPSPTARHQTLGLAPSRASPSPFPRLAALAPRPRPPWHRGVRSTMRGEPQDVACSDCELSRVRCSYLDSLVTTRILWVFTSRRKLLGLVSIALQNPGCPSFNGRKAWIRAFYQAVLPGGDFRPMDLESNLLAHRSNHRGWRSPTIGPSLGGLPTAERASGSGFSLLALAAEVHDEIRVEDLVDAWIPIDNPL